MGVMVARRITLAIAVCLLLAEQASAACSSLRMAAEIKQLSNYSDVTIQDGEVTEVDDGPITPKERELMDSISDDRLLTGPFMSFSDDLNDRDRHMISHGLARVLNFADQTCHCHRSLNRKDLSKDEKSEMKCACSKGEMAALEAKIKHHSNMQSIAASQLEELARMKESCNALISAKAPAYKIKKCLAAVAAMSAALGKHVDVDDNSEGTQCTNRMSREKRYKLIVAQERLHNATVRLKREQDERYKLVVESVAKKIAAANAQYKPTVTQAQLDRAAQQLENAQNSAKAAQAYYNILQDNFVGFLQEKAAEVRSTLA